MGTWQNRITHFGEAKELSEEEYYTITAKTIRLHMPRLQYQTVAFLVFFRNSTETSCHRHTQIYLCYNKEMGIIEGVCFALYVIILIRSGMVQGKQKSFSQISNSGSAMMLSIQAFVNMAVAVNLIPVTDSHSSYK